MSLYFFRPDAKYVSMNFLSLYQLANFYFKSGSGCTVCAYASLSGILGNFLIQ
jgi:hypothetical protein